MEGKSVLQLPTNVNTTLEVKLKFRGDIRRFSCQHASVDALRAEFVKRYGAKIPQANFVLKYQDDEGDLISLNSEQDLAAAVRCISKTNGILKLHVAKKKASKEDATAGNASTVPSQACQQPTPATQRAEAKPTISTEDRRSSKLERKQRSTEKPHRVHRHREERLEEQKLGKDKKKKDAQHSDKLHVQLVRDDSKERIEVAPGSKFVQSWKFRNPGTCSWPTVCQLVVAKKHPGDRMGAPEHVSVPTAVAGEEIEVVLNLTAPNEPGKHVGFWHLCLPDGKKFGRCVKAVVHVTSPSSDEDQPEISQNALLTKLERMGFSDQELNEKLLRRHHDDLGLVVYSLTKKKERLQKKAAREEAKAKRLQEKDKRAPKEHLRRK
jgi:hypothetical protein